MAVLTQHFFQDYQSLLKLVVLLKPVRHFFYFLHPTQYLSSQLMKYDKIRYTRHNCLL